MSNIEITPVYRYHNHCIEPKLYKKWEISFGKDIQSIACIDRNVLVLLEEKNYIDTGNTSTVGLSLINGQEKWTLNGNSDLQYLNNYFIYYSDSDMELRKPDDGGVVSSLPLGKLPGRNFNRNSLTLYREEDGPIDIYEIPRFEIVQTRPVFSGWTIVGDKSVIVEEKNNDLKVFSDVYLTNEIFSIPMIQEILGSNGNVVLALKRGEDRRVVLIDVNKLEIIWEIDIEEYYYFTLTGDRCLCYGGISKMKCIELGNGKICWENELEYSTRTESGVVSGPNLWVSDKDSYQGNFLRCYDIETGELKYEREFKSRILIVAAAFDRLLVQTRSKVICLGPRKSELG